jgi:hypothetical protein
LASRSNFSPAGEPAIVLVHAWSRGQVEDIIETVALVMIAIGVTATAFYAGKIYGILKK